MTQNAEYPVSKIDTADTTMELRCVCLKPYIRYLEDRFGTEKMRQSIAETRMSLEYLANPDNWVSYAYVTRLLHKLVEVSGNKRAPFDAACHYTDRVSYGALGLFLLHLGSPATMYKLIVSFHSLWNRIGECRMETFGKRHCTIAVSYQGRSQDRNNCLALQGSLAAVPRQFGLPFARIRHTQCSCDGAPACVYEVKWQNRPESVWPLVAFIVGAASGAVAGSIAEYFVSDTAMYALFFALLAYLLTNGVNYRRALETAYRQNDDQAASLLESIRAAEKLNEELQKKVEERTEELRKTNEDLKNAVEDLRNSQEKALQAERQAVVGVLAAGVAHEMNSPISAIMLSLQAIKETVGKDERRLDPALDTIARAGNRSKRLVDELLSFSREPRQMAAARPEEILDASLAIFRKDSSTGICVTRRVAENLPALWLDRMQIRQALINLLVNASDAMNGTGEIEVSMETNGSELILSVKDHGPGIKPEVMEHLFEPFFTTKNRGEPGHGGTGLGLAITSQLVRRNGGAIEAVSREGEGAIFIMKFPLPAASRGQGSDGTAV